MTTTAATFIQPGTDKAADPAETMELLEHPVLDGRLYRLVQAARNTLPDTDLRAESRVWGSYPKAMRAMTRPLDREDRPKTDLVAAGQTREAPFKGALVSEWVDPVTGDVETSTL